MAVRRHESPLRRCNPSGRVVWVARFTDRHGKRRSAGTFDLRREAQDAIDAAYERDGLAPRRPDTVGAYAATWTDRHPRAHRTNKSYDHRLGRMLDISLDGVPFRDWPMADVRRRQANDLVHHLLTRQKRSQQGAIGMLRVCSTMWQDALDDEVVEANPFYGVKVKASDPRIEKQARQIRVWSWEEMRGFAKHAATVRTGAEGDAKVDRWRKVYAEPMIRVFSDCGPRLGEVLPLRRADLRLDGCSDARCKAQGPHFHIERTAHEGSIQAGTKIDHGEVDAGRVVPIPPGLEELLRGLPRRIDTPLLFPSPTGRLWRESTFYRDVWRPAWEGSAVQPRPHEMRHSFVSHMRAAGVDDADLAAITGHTVLTMLGRYTHSLGQSFDAVRAAVG